MLYSLEKGWVEREGKQGKGKKGLAKRGLMIQVCYLTNAVVDVPLPRAVADARGARKGIAITRFLG